MRLKDEWSEQMDYYNLMFSQLLQYEVGQEDHFVHINNWWGDRPNHYSQTIPYNHVYIQVNSDEHDHMLVDPAYRLERIKDAQEKYYGLQAA